MEIPLEITYRNVQATPGLDNLIRSKAAKLEEYCEYITSCRVIVEQPERHQHTGRPYHVRLDIAVPPGHRIAVHHEPRHVEQIDSAETEIRRAFDEAFRKLQELKERQNRHVKSHDRLEAIVETLQKDDGYGFLRTIDNRHIYFHRNSVSGKEFESLRPGIGVTYLESMGDKGPQATFVRITGKKGPGVRRADAP